MDAPKKTLRELIVGIFRPSMARDLPPPQAPKVKKGAMTTPSHLKRAGGASSGGDSKMAENDRRSATTDISQTRLNGSTKATIRTMSQVSPDVSASVYAYTRMVVTRDFVAVARNRDGTCNPEATTLCQQVMTRFNYLQDYTDGFSGMFSIHSIGEAMVRELLIEGSCALELVLDKTLSPDRLSPISTSQIVWMQDKSNYSYPVQKTAGGEEISLDVPTFFYEALDQDLLSAYSSSPLEAGVSAAIRDAEFTNDVRRVIKRAIHPRIDVEIDMDKFSKTIPNTIKGDPEAEKTYLEQYIANLSAEVNQLDPDDALIHLDNIKFDYLNNGNITLNREYETLQGMVNAKLATGTKAPPSVLGHGTGSQNIASTETMLFVRYAEGVQNKVNSIISRALTMALRLLGEDVYVDFRFSRIDLRPDSELEAFRAMKQSRVLELLSLGLISDDEAALELVGRLPADGAPKLQGTNFKGSSAQNVNNAPLSNTGAQDMKPQTPTQPKSQNQKARKNET